MEQNGGILSRPTGNTVPPQRRANTEGQQP